MKEALLRLNAGAETPAEEEEPAPPPTPRETAILKEYRFSEDDIGLMWPEAREQHVKDAFDAGIKEPGGSRAEPIDLKGQE